jgi:hypothetical protein
MRTLFQLSVVGRLTAFVDSKNFAGLGNYLIHVTAMCSAT